jgi:hypothetical protein
MLSADFALKVLNEAGNRCLNLFQAHLEVSHPAIPGIIDIEGVLGIFIQRGSGGIEGAKHLDHTTISPRSFRKPARRRSMTRGHHQDQVAFCEHRTRKLSGSMCVKGGIAISSLNQDLARPAIKTVADFLIRDSGRIDLNQSLKAATSHAARSPPWGNGRCFPCTPS